MMTFQLGATTGELPLTYAATLSDAEGSAYEKRNSRVPRVREDDQRE